MSLHTRLNCAANKLSLNSKLPPVLHRLFWNEVFWQKMIQIHTNSRIKVGEERAANWRGKSHALSEWGVIHPSIRWNLIGQQTSEQLVVLLWQRQQQLCRRKLWKQRRLACLLALSLSCEHLVRRKVENRRIEKMNIHRSHQKLSILTFLALSLSFLPIIT